MGDVGDWGVEADWQLRDIIFVADEIHLAVDLTQRSLDFRMTGVTDEHHSPALRNVPAPLDMHLGDQRAGGVDRGKRTPLRLVDDPPGNAVSAEDRHCALGDFVQFVDEARPFGGQLLDNMPIMNNLVAHVDRRAMLDQRPLDDIDGSNDSRAKSPRLGKNNLHSLLLSPRFGVITTLTPPCCALPKTLNGYRYAAIILQARASFHEWAR